MKLESNFRRSSTYLERRLVASEIISRLFHIQIRLAISPYALTRIIKKE